MIAADINYYTTSKWLTGILDKLPFYKTNEESTVNLYAEIAHAKYGYSTASDLAEQDKGMAYLDDFEIILVLST